ncbi:MAG: glycerol-3-phosphate 1-O-acyltransferase PlsY, partial [Firmicutes bacterium]|nr:glycerol-3-phosphate 1-O-acyltransferase PlsY [Bacillota bacterium]
MVKIIITVVVSYLLGSISPAILLGRARGINIKKEGSGNAGTTNVLRVMGGKAAIVTLTVDILKGFLPALIFGMIFGDTFGYIACLAAFIGHVFPIYYGFKGGKGVAVAFGGLLGVNWKIALLCLATVVVFTLISKRMSVGSIAGAASAIIYALIFEKSFLIYVTIMALLIIFMHRGNIKSLLNHEEPPLSFLDKSK